MSRREAQDRYIKLKRRISGSKLARATLMISGATMVAQVVGVAAAPLMTRLFSPAEYGSFFVLNSIALAVAAGFALRLEQAVPLPSEDDEARSLVAAAIAATLFLSLAACIATIFLGSYADGHLELSSGPRSLILVAPLAASFAVYAVMNAVAIREGRFGAVARRHLVMALLMVVLQVVAGLIGGGLVGLCLATIVAQTAGALTMLIGSPLFAARWGPRGFAVRAAVSKYRHFPLVLAPSGWLNSLGANAPLVVIGAVYSSGTAGLFGLTLRVVALPAAFVGAAVASVYFSELARRRREEAGAELKLFYTVSRLLALGGILFAIVLVAVAPAAFRLVFGSEWAGAGDMARAYALAACAQMIASPISGTLTVFERVFQQISWDAARLVAVVASVVLSASSGASALTTVWVLAGVTALTYAVNWEMCRRTLKSSLAHSQ